MEQLLPAGDQSASNYRMLAPRGMAARRCGAATRAGRCLLPTAYCHASACAGAANTPWVSGWVTAVQSCAGSAHGMVPQCAPCAMGCHGLLNSLQHEMQTAL